MNRIRTVGHYFGRYDIGTEEYSGADFSRICFIFPGQGSAVPGMFKRHYLGFESVREMFRKADILVERNGLGKVSDYIVRPGNVAEETLPIVRNLALFTMEVALHEALVAKGIVPEIVTGHSFGEYAALVASGTVPFEEMFEIVRYRDTACPKANALGFMIAVGSDEAGVADILKGEAFHVSNINSHRQTVISVAPGDVGRTEAILKGSGTAYKVLSDVPQPYHSPFLDGTREKMRAYVRGLEISVREPKIPLFSSVSRRLITRDNFREEDIRTILIDQLTAPVDFVFQISSIHSLGCFNFMELGERGTFSSFVGNILAGSEIKTDSVANVLKSEKTESAKVIDTENSKLLSLVSRIIGEITGYEIEKISFEDRFQEDLGIDSIKKADILLTVLSESKIDPGEDFNTSKFGSVRDTVEYLRAAEKEIPAKSKKPLPERKTSFGRYVFSWKEAPLSGNLPLPEKETGSVLIDAKDISLNPEKTLETLIRFLAGNIGSRPVVMIRAESEDFEVAKMLGFFRFWNAFLRTSGTEGFDLALIASGDRNPLVDGYASFLKSMKKESPDMFFRYIRFDDDVPEPEVSAVVRKEFRRSSGEDVLYRKGKRFVSVRERAGETEGGPGIDGHSVILVIGGAKGIAFSLVRNISRKYKPTIFLVGRSPESDASVRANVGELRKDNPNIRYESLNARDADSLKGLFSRIRNGYGKIDMVINAAGTVSIRFIRDKDERDAEREFRDKVVPAVNIMRLASEYRVGRVINFSSVISKYGSAGQSMYTSANAVLAGVTAGYGFGSVIHWPPWDGVGMTRQQGILRNLNEQGVSLLKPGTADELFSVDLVSGGPGEVYYMDENDDFLYGFGLNGFADWKPLIGTLADPFSLSARIPVFGKTFDRSADSYLKDHLVGGKSYVPAAVGLMMFYRSADMCGIGSPVLENFTVHNPVIVRDEPLACELKIEMGADDGRLSLKSSVLHFSCRAKGSYGTRPVGCEIGPIDGKTSTDPIYSDRRSEDGLYLGPTFRSIGKSFSDDEGKPFFRIDNTVLLPVLGLGSYDRLIQWVDASFQALGIAGSDDGRQSVPVGVSEFAVFPDTRISDYLYVMPLVKRSASGDIRGDVTVVNEAGETVLGMKDVFLRNIGGGDGTGAESSRENGV